jgi:hypothetical protein
MATKLNHRFLINPKDELDLNYLLFSEKRALFAQEKAGDNLFLLERPK